MDIRPVSFRCHGSEVRGDLYLPSASAPPIVVMAHGIGANRHSGLPPFAERFAAEGMAALLFDHRGFGESGGEPRALVDPERHREDWVAAIAFARSLGEVDGARVGLWGTSFSGSHALLTAARIGGISAVIAQVPHVDGLAESLVYPPRLLPGALALAVRDLASAAIGGEPVRMPLVARSGPRLLAGPDCEEGSEEAIRAGIDFFLRHLTTRRPGP